MTDRATAQIRMPTEASSLFSLRTTFPMRRSCWNGPGKMAAARLSVDREGMEGWLCPACSSIRAAPEKLYIQVKAAGYAKWSH